MTGQERDYEAILSRVLHTTTDQLEPVGDGLTKIRARLDEPWLKRQWWLLRSELMVLRWLVVVRCEAFFSTVKPGKSGSPAADSAAGALAPLLACATPAADEHGRRRRSQRPVLGRTTAWVASRGPGRGHEDGPRSSHGPAMSWLRPALAVAGAVVIVVGGVFALGNIQQGFGFIGLGADGGTQPGSSSQGGGNPYGGGATLKSSSSPSQGRSGAPKPGASAAHNRTLPSPGPCISPTTPTSASPSPSPSPTSASPSPSPTSASPSPTPTTPSPSPSTSDAPITSGMAGHSQAPIGTTALVMCEQRPPSASPSPSNQAPGGP
jgi:hypothetical protein